MGGNVLEFTDANFSSQVLESDQLTIVDFWAPWCGPCRNLGPKIDAIADEYAGRVRVGKMNVDENPNTAGEYNVSGIPLVLFIKGGQVVQQVMGDVPKPRLVSVVDTLLAAHG